MDRKFGFTHTGEPTEMMAASFLYKACFHIYSSFVVFRSFEFSPNIDQGRQAQYGGSSIGSEALQRGQSSFPQIPVICA